MRPTRPIVVGIIVVLVIIIAGVLLKKRRRCRGNSQCGTGACRDGACVRVPPVVTPPAIPGPTGPPPPDTGTCPPELVYAVQYAPGEGIPLVAGCRISTPDKEWMVFRDAWFDGSKTMAHAMSTGRTTVADCATHCKEVGGSAWGYSATNNGECHVYNGRLDGTMKSMPGWLSGVSTSGAELATRT